MSRRLKNERLKDRVSKYWEELKAPERLKVAMPRGSMTKLSLSVIHTGQTKPGSASSQRCWSRWELKLLPFRYHITRVQQTCFILCRYLVPSIAIWLLCIHP